MKSRLAAVVGFVALLAALSGCDPWPVPTDSTKASMSVDFGAEGGADVRLILGGQIVTHAPLQRTGDAAAAALFPAAVRRSVSVGGNDGGYPLVHIHAAGVYKPGAHPVVSIDTRPALAVLASMGYRNVDVEIRAPGVPTVASWRTVPGSVYYNSWSWPGLVPGSVGPSGTIALTPQPWRGLGELGLSVLCLACLYAAVLGLHRRRRAVAGGAAFLACAAVATDTITAGAVQLDNMGVAGWVNGQILTLAEWVWIPATLAAIATVCIFFVTLDRTRPRTVVPQFNAPPGWPPAPPGWRPASGWHPDPTWPAAPPGWTFYPASSPYQAPDAKD